MTTSKPTPSLQDKLFLFIHEAATQYCPTDIKKIFDSGGSVNPIFPPKYTNNDIIKNCIPQTDVLINRNNKPETALFYLKDAIYAALVPDIRFYKVIYELKDGFPDPDRKKLIECPFPRSARNNITDAAGNLVGQSTSGADIKKFAQPLVDRRGQIGVKSFDWNYVGTDSYTALRDIEAELTLTMDGIAALSAQRQNEAGQRYRLMDLLIQSDCFKDQTGGTQAPNTSAPLKYDPGCYEILVEAGYLIDEDKLKDIIKKMGIPATDYSPVFFTDAEIEEAIRNFSIDKLRSTLYLTVVDHKFTFGENGKVECTVNYRARSAVTSRFSDTNIYYSAEQNRILRIFKRKIEAAEAILEAKVVRGTSAASKAEKEAVKRYLNLPSNIYASAKVGPRPGITTRTSVEKTQEIIDEFRARREEFIENDVNDPATGFGPEIFTILETQKKLYRFSESTVQPELTTYFESPNLANLSAVKTKFKTKPSAFGTGPGGRAGRIIPATIEPIGVSTTSRATFEGSDDIFYFFGDLLDAILFRTRGTSPSAGSIRTQVYKNYRFILGNVKLANPTRGPSVYTLIPLAAFPIANGVFRKIVEDLKAQKSPRISFTGFVNKLLKVIEKSFTVEATKIAFSDKKLLFNTLTFNHYADSTKPLEIQDVTYTPYQRAPVPLALNVDLVNLSEDRIPVSGGRVSLLPLLQQTISKLDEDIINNFNLYHIVCFAEESGNNFAKRKYGNIVEDFKINIPHFSHGQGYGLIKKVTLEKSDIPFAKEQRFEQANKTNELDGRADFYLTNFYNATFEMIGNDLCSLGGYIYFDPFGLAPDGSLGEPNQSSPPSLSYIMGLGGIHIITKISHKMTPGKYTTTVKTRWENRGALKSS
jgi:hypothetical protein